MHGNRRAQRSDGRGAYEVVIDVPEQPAHCIAPKLARAPCRPILEEAMREAEPVLACIEADLGVFQQTRDHASNPVSATCTHHSAAKPAWTGRHSAPTACADLAASLSLGRVDYSMGCSAARLEQSRRSAADGM